MSPEKLEELRRHLNPTNQQYNIAPAPSGFGQTREQLNQTINQTITHNGDAKDTKAVKQLHKTAAKQAADTYYKRQTGAAN